MTAVIQDVKYAARMLRRNPAFTAVAVTALGLGIGANTAIFSLVYGLLLRPLVFRDLNHLALVWETVPDSGDRSSVSPANFFDWQRQNHVFERMTFYRSWDASVTSVGESERVDACQVSDGSCGCWHVSHMVEKSALLTTSSISLGKTAAHHRGDVFP